MNRGMFSEIANEPAYKDAIKRWYAELQYSQMFWYELLVEGHEGVDLRKHIVDYMKNVKKQVEANLEKRFIYFICSRKKLRFNTETTSVLTSEGKLKLSFLAGKEQKKIELEMDAPRVEGGTILASEIDPTGRFITFGFSNDQLYTYPIHDFLAATSINLGFEANVEYVGYTENPHTRPLNGAHTGLNDVLYRVSTDDNDILIYFNQFKVMARAENEMAGVNFMIPNSMTDEIKVDLEGQILEKCFIFYFDSANQFRNKVRERSELESHLVMIATKNKIGSVSINLEVDSDDDYYNFSSSRVKAKKRHSFTAEIIANKLSITDGLK